MEDLQFSVKEMSAILKITKVMIMADGIMDAKEKQMVEYLLNDFGIDENDPTVFLLSDAMEFDIAIATIKNMSLSQKRYFTAYLGAMMAVDEEIDEKETALWQMVSMLCQLPTMTIKDAVNIFLTEN